MLHIYSLARKAGFVNDCGWFIRSEKLAKGKGEEFDVASLPVSKFSLKVWRPGPAKLMSLYRRSVVTVMLPA
jgi:hypothetical protein